MGQITFSPENKNKTEPPRVRGKIARISFLVIIKPTNLFLSLGMDSSLRYLNLSRTSLSSLTAACLDQDETSSLGHTIPVGQSSNLEMLDISGNYLTFPIAHLSWHKKLKARINK